MISDPTAAVVLAPNRRVTGAPAAAARIEPIDIEITEVLLVAAPL
ncbi:hypothetical protein [Tessaracoccus flavescens]|nr:hypothetical protein [Tessaracoccus flavescens]